MLCRAPTSSATCTGGSPTGAGLTYDHEGQLVGWTSALNGNPTPATAAFAYDGEGARVALKTTTGTGIVTTTDYLLGGLEEQQSVGGSVRPSSTLTEYYPLPGIGTAVRVTTSSGTSTLSYLASDQLGSVSVALNTTGTVTAQALYRPYGTLRYSSGTMPTAHGYTGQLADGMTGLDYYGARYYDPTLGEFTSADTHIEGGLDRYAYVGGNPTTATDPSGHAQCYECVGAAAGGDWFNSGGVGPGTTVLYDLAEYTLGLVSMYHDVKTILNPDADLATKLGAFGDVLVQGGLDVLMLTGEGEELRGAELSGRTADELTRAAVKASEWTDDAAKAGLVADDGLNVPGRVAEEDAAKAAAAEAGDEGPRPHGGGSPGDEGPGHGGGPSSGGGSPPDPCGGLSFSADTAVATPQGEQPMASLHVGDAVEAYDPATGTTSVQHVQQVFIHHDTDRLDVTLRSAMPADEQAGNTADENGVSTPGRVAAQASGRQPGMHSGKVETVHTTASHPWLTADRGWARAGMLHVGESVVTADGSPAVVVALRVVAGAADMWDLTVSNVHTFVVGAGAYVVHNCAGTPPPGTKIVGTPSGNSVPVPDNWPGRVANNGKGLVFQEPGAPGDANLVRIMDPTPRYPQGYLVYYNGSGQALDAYGNVASRATWHIPLDTLGGIPGYYAWLGGFVP